MAQRPHKVVVQSATKQPRLDGGVECSVSAVLQEVRKIEKNIKDLRACSSDAVEAPMKTLERLLGVLGIEDETLDDVVCTEVRILVGLSKCFLS